MKYLRNLKEKNTGGFTLLEVMMASGIIAIISIVIVQVFFATTRANAKAELLKEIKQNGEFTLEVISRLIRSSKSIDSACSTVGSTTTTLALTNADGGTTTIGCVQVGSSARIASTSGTGKVEYLTSGDVTVAEQSCLADNTLTFICNNFGEDSSTIKVLFTLTQPGVAVSQFEQGSADFQTTVATRN